MSQDTFGGFGESVKIAIETDSKQKQVILDYLEENASDRVKEMLNAGTKTLDGCYTHLKDKVRAQAEDGMAMVADDVVWEIVINFFEDDTIDDPELKKKREAEERKKKQAEQKAKKKPASKKTAKKKKQEENDLFQQQEAEKAKAKMDEEAPKQETPKVVNLFSGERVDASDLEKAAGE